MAAIVAAVLHLAAAGRCRPRCQAWREALGTPPATQRRLQAITQTPVRWLAEARERRSVKLQGIEEVGFKEELRFELVYDVALGIGVILLLGITWTRRRKVELAPSARVEAGAA